MDVAGIVFGLLGALCQSVAYVFLRLYVMRRRESVISLLVTSHILMGVGATIMLCVLARSGLPAFHSYGAVLFRVTGFYLLGQIGLFSMMRKIEASRAAPLLGFKVVFLAIIGVVFFGRIINGHQWLAVLLCVVAALGLNFSGGSLPLTSVLGLCGVCVFYSLSDLNIERRVVFLGQSTGSMRASLISVSMSYVLSGIVAVGAYPVLRRHVEKQDWLYAVPYSLGWFLGMVCLFVCFGYVGAIYGNILQASRGVMSVIMGAVLAWAGHVHLEQRVSRFVLWRRLLAAILMVCAIWLFGR